MPPRRVLVRLLVATGLALPAGACSDDDQAPLGERAQFRKFALYYVGDSFHGHRLRRDRSGLGTQRSTRSVSFLYGDCEPQDDAGSRRLRIRRAPAAVYGEGDRLEVYTGDVTVVIHAGGDLPATREAAGALRSVDGRIGPDDPLPPPSRTALTGRPRC